MLAGSYVCGHMDLGTDSLNKQNTEITTAHAGGKQALHSVEKCCLGPCLSNEAQAINWQKGVQKGHDLKLLLLN